MTQPAVSQHVKALEQELDVKIFDRSKGKIVVTRQGEMVIRCAQKIVGLANSLRQELKDSLDNVEHLTANYRPTLNGERFFTDKEVSARLKVSRRTLQDYRNEGRIAYIQLGGNILYRESDIEKMLADGYRTAYRLKAP